MIPLKEGDWKIVINGQGFVGKIIYREVFPRVMSGVRVLRCWNRTMI